jgi:hypothetical protein
VFVLECRPVDRGPQLLGGVAGAGHELQRVAQLVRREASDALLAEQASTPAAHAVGLSPVLGAAAGLHPAAEQGRHVHAMAVVLDEDLALTLYMTLVKVTLTRVASAS